MAKMIHKTGTPLDIEVRRFLQRVGALNEPLNHVVGYEVKRRRDDAHRLVIEFVADDRFDESPADGPAPVTAADVPPAT